MEYERNKRYFTQNLPSWPMYIAITVTVIGLVLMFVGSRTHTGRTLIPIALGILAVGLIGAMVYSSIKVKDADIDGNTERAPEKFLEAFKEKYANVNAARHKFDMMYGSGVVHPGEKFDPTVVSTYCFDAEGVLLKKGADNKLRSSSFACSGFAFRPKGICFGRKDVELVNPANAKEDVFKEVSYLDIGKAELKLVSLDEYGQKTKFGHIIVTDNNGEVIFDLPVLADAAIDDYVFQINQRVEHFKMKYGENNQ